MAVRNEIGVVYGAGLVQGVALVTFPAASSILTSPDYYGLTSTAYGALFLPQAVLAIVASLAGASLTRRLGLKRIFVVGLIADFAAMGLLFLSQFAIGTGSLSYAMLLLATSSLGIGFGLTVPSINRYAAAFFPERVERAVLYLNALLGLGTALAPVFVAIFVGLGFWWGLPVLVAILLAGLVGSAVRLPLRIDAADGASAEQAGQIGGSAAGPSRLVLPRRFWTFAAFALLYGIVETMNGNWATLFMTADLGASAALASLALTVFWAMVTVGRILFAAIERRVPEADTFRLLPFVAAAAFLLTAALPAGDATLGVLAFGLAGLGCSALLPLTLGFGQQELTTIAAFAAGGLIAFYQIGYGLAAFGVGPLLDDLGIDLATIYRATAIVAVAMGLLSFVVIRGRRQALG
jgi:fucose permease